ncbi:ATP-binding protein [Lysinibacillus sp. A4]|uniref:ATP-binding protein n=1 Tax=Lysinibacillus sp. A4 TaxID=2976269 RepID=UPI002175B53D|nr:ATP-binding protein [Lysinibacillus sp. A4]MCS5501646.1 ATP-binding protein [Lysinibacillus sp. A4]
MNDCILLQSSQDWHLQRMYMKKFNKLVLVKSVHHNSAETRAKLQYEFFLFSNEQNPWLLKPIAIDYIDDQYAIIYENFNGVPLKQFSNNLISLHQFLQIAIDLVNICMKMQQSGLLYLHLHPNQILINPNSLKIKLLSSEFSTKYDVESPVVIENPYERLDQLPYYAPEQTGRLHLEVDYRTDLYALGTIFYEILGGQLPFQAKDAVDLIYEIITKKPEPLVSLDSRYHSLLWEMIEKLLAKNPADRYQSAIGLREDLLQIQQKLLVNEPLDNFLLGEQDLHLNTGLSTKLYGRESQFAELSSVFRQVAKGDKKMVTISGQAGYGKSKLVQELKGEIAAAKGYFITTKYEQLQLENDYSIVIHPLRSLLKFIYMEGERSVHLWKKLFQEVKLVVTDELIHLLPELKWFVKEEVHFQKEVSQNTKQLHSYTFISIQKILLTFAMQKKPVIWFVDDLHWANQSTVEIMTQIFEQHRAGYFMMIGTFRVNKDSAEEENQQRTSSFSSGHHIHLPLLQEQHVQQWLEASFQAKPHTIQIIAKQLFNLTKGNPLFVKEAFRSLQQDNTIYFNATTKEWEFNRKKFNLSRLNNELLVFIETRMANLTTEAHEILRIVACFGQRFEFTDVLKLVSLSAQALLKHLETLVENGFIIPLDAHYKWASTLEHEGILHTFSTKFQFVHDRIQQVAYQDLSGQLRAKYHYQIGQLLTDDSQMAADHDRLSEIVMHFNYSRHLLTGEEKQKLAIWNYQLGIEAKRIGLFDNALKFFTTSKELLTPDHWETRREQSVKLYANLGECEYLTGHYEQSEMHLTEALQHAETKLEKLMINNLKTVLYIESDNPTIGLEAGLAGFQVANLKISAYPKKSQLLKEYLLLKWALRHMSDQDLLQHPPTNSKEIDILIHLIINMTASAFLLNPNLTGILLMKGLRLQLKYGATSKSGMVLINYAMLLNAGFTNIKEATRFGKLAIIVADKQESIYIKGHTYYVYGVFISHWTEPYETSIQYINEAQAKSQELGLYHLVSSASCFIVTIRLIQGVVTLEDLQQEIRRQQDEFSIHASTLSIDFLAEMGRWMNILRSPHHPVHWACPITIQDQPAIKIMHYSVRLQMSFLLADEIQGKAILVELKKLSKDTYTLPITTVYYFYRAMWQFHFLHSQNCQVQEQRLFLTDIRQSLKKFKKWAVYSSENYEHLYALLMAENYRLHNNDSEAELYYDRAIRLASMNGFVQDTALAYERAANYYLAKQQKKTARHYILNGIQSIETWGAETVASRWAREYQVHRKLENHSRESLTFDMMTVFETTQSFATAIRMEELLHKILFSLLKHVGADSGYFIHKQQQELLVLAKAEAAEKTFTMYDQQSMENFNANMQSIIRYVLNSKEHVIIDNTQITQHPLFSYSTAKSILCLPIIHQNEIISILYFENTLMTNAFHPSHVQLLKVIAAQIAVSFENAKIYGDLEKRVQLRTRELDETNRHLIKMNERLEKNELERKKLLHSISHELRSPLTSTLGYIELMLEGVIDDAVARKKYLIRSKERLLSLNNLIQDLFDLANLEAGRAEFSFTEVKAKELFLQMATRYEDEVKQSGLTFSAHFYGHEEAQLLIDKTRINQVIENIMTNAMKYTSNGGIQLSFHVEDKHLICSIADSGIGIAESDLPFIFDSYYRATNTHEAHSHGIGLAICKQIVRQHNGEIFVESLENEGSIFSFTLPLVKVLAKN